MEDEAVLRSKIEVNPGGPECVRLAGLLKKKGRLYEALDTCYAGLSANPANHHARLLMARIFAEQGYFEFAAREVRHLMAQLPKNNALEKLLQCLAPWTNAASALKEDSSNDSGATLAETEIDISVVDQLDREQGG